MLDRATFCYIATTTLLRDLVADRREAARDDRGSHTLEYAAAAAGILVVLAIVIAAIKRGAVAQTNKLTTK